MNSALHVTEILLTPLKLPEKALWKLLSQGETWGSAFCVNDSLTCGEALDRTENLVIISMAAVTNVYTKTNKQTKYNPTSKIVENSVWKRLRRRWWLWLSFMCQTCEKNSLIWTIHL